MLHAWISPSTIRWCPLALLGISSVEKKIARKNLGTLFLLFNSTLRTNIFPRFLLWKLNGNESWAFTSRSSYKRRTSKKSFYDWNGDWDVWWLTARGEKICRDCCKTLALILKITSRRLEILVQRVDQFVVSKWKGQQQYIKLQFGRFVL